MIGSVIPFDFGMLTQNRNLGTLRSYHDRPQKYGLAISETRRISTFEAFSVAKVLSLCIMLETSYTRSKAVYERTRRRLQN